MSRRWGRLAELLVGGAILAVAYLAANVFTPYFLAVAVPLLIIYFTLIYRRVQLRALRIAGGLCAKCGYDLTGNISGVCPECGTAAADHA